MSGLFKAKPVTTTSKQNPYDGLPDWATDYYKDDAATGGAVMDSAAGIADWMAKHPQQIAGMSPDERAALDGMMGQTNTAMGQLNDARDALGGDRYMSGYTDNVVDTTLAGMDRNYARDMAARGASEASIGGMGGTRAAVADALGGQLHGMDRAQMEAKLRDDAFRFGSEMGLNESGQIESLAKSGMDVAGQAAATQGAYGAMTREQQQAQMDAKRNAKKDAMSWYTDVFNSSRQLPSTGGGTTTGQQPGKSPISNILGAAASAAGIWSAMSDERVKEDIEVEDHALDKLRDLDAYSYRYKDGYGHTREETTGLMAQDLERSGIVGAVRERSDGVKMVEPYAVLATVVAAVRELDDRTRSNAGLEAA
jgi:hypothetical protein